MYVCMYVCMYVYIYIYIYISMSLSLSIYIYIYRYTYTHTFLPLRFLSSGAEIHLRSHACLAGTRRLSYLYSRSASQRRYYH